VYRYSIKTWTFNRCNYEATGNPGEAWLRGILVGEKGGKNRVNSGVDIKCIKLIGGSATYSSFKYIYDLNTNERVTI
jgi:hypothetical protein